MLFKLLGIQPINFTNNSGETINGTNIFVVYKDENVEGLKTEKFFLKSGIEIPKEVKLNDSLDIAFNMKGKVEMISKA